MIDPRVRFAAYVFLAVMAAVVLFLLYVAITDYRTGTGGP